ncbi:alpha/beta hydrolase [Planomicrobium sp. CPCC 101079]|uniref:alpha/beta hydrolase n=1 Tax=Planomicrobium sp. CPCC 101079 TaxID=2599618 RepID=UPI0011B518B0|nr:alpha/beta hydrolase [Planomicrobium sp. CPCC 101079]TWT12507.1 alpha/beta hydrolase [Planomicrobium sp. CPCC 101079]
MWKWEAAGQAKAVIVLIHSAYEHHLRYAWPIEQWRSQNFNVIMGDLPGHGEGIDVGLVHEESFDDYEQAVRLSVEAAHKDSLPVFVVGHGLGATLAMNVLSKNSFAVAGAVFTSPWLQLIKTPFSLSKSVPGLHKLMANMKLDHDIQVRHLTRNIEVIVAENDDNLYNTLITAGWYNELQAYMKGTEQGRNRFPDIPVFVQTGEKDEIIDIAAAKQWLLQQDLTEFSFKEWKNCYHDLFQEPEREDIFISSHLFMKNVLRSLGYLVE